MLPYDLATSTKECCAIIGDYLPPKKDLALLLETIILSDTIGSEVSPLKIGTLESETTSRAFWTAK